MSDSGIESGEESGTGIGLESRIDTGIVAISRNGAQLARTVAASLVGEGSLYLERRLADGGADASALTNVTTFDLPLRPVLERLFERHRRLVLFMPVGAAVRLLAPCLQHKHNDPAVVCVDDAGRFAVSLLSGHVGGGDALAEEVSRILGATPVITSASHVMNTLAVDLLGREFGWQIQADSETITRVSAAVVNGEPVGVFQEAGEPDWWPLDKPLPGNVTVYTSLEELAESSSVAALVITDRLLAGIEESKATPASRNGKRTVVYRPRSLVVGMGCRRGVSREHLEELMVSVFRRHNLARPSLACIATAELKRDEPGILELAEQYGVPVQCYGAEKLNQIFAESEAGSAAGSRAGPVGAGPTPSAAHRLLGVWGVSEPAALLASGRRELLVTREKTDRATVAVARIAYTASPLSPAPLPQERQTLSTFSPGERGRGCGRQGGTNQ